MASPWSEGLGARVCNILQYPPPYKAQLLDQARRRDAATGETVSWDEATWRLAAAGQGTRYHANYPDYKTCPRHHICS